MTWIARLYETYKQALALNLNDDERLMPISHTLQNAHINIVIDEEGNFLDATVIKEQIILPATERSAGRSSGGAPHPLADKLQYVAQDYSDYGGKKGAYFNDFEASSIKEYDYIDSNTKKPMWMGYKNLLKKWCESPHAHIKAQAVYRYVEKGKVISDLIKAKIIYVDSNNELLTQWTDKSEEGKLVPELIKILPKNAGEFDQGSALICWTVQTKDNDPNQYTWKDESLFDSWIAFDASRDAKEGLCYVLGNEKPLASNHPAKLRHTGDKAKLISFNDSSGFTYRGRFIEAAEACNVSFDVTQKAHNALRWLISRKVTYKNGDQIIIAWALSGKTIPNPLLATYELPDFSIEDLEIIDTHEDTEEIIKIDHSRDLGQLFANKLKSKLKGYREELGELENIIIMAVDSATPGRMAITYYQEFLARDFIDRLELWHSQFAWPQYYTRKIEGKKNKSTTVWPISAPPPYIIAQAAYGKTLTDSLKKNIIERLVPCIIEGKPLPIDIVNACVNRAVNHNSGEYWECERNLGVACALFRGFYNRHPIEFKRRNYLMTLEIENTSRDYLYGRLLAVAERIEKVALSVAKENRATTAERLMQRFSERPYSTWLNIELALRPYMQRLQNNREGFLVKQKKLLDDIITQFNPNEFTNDKKLSGEFLLGYHCQRREFHNKNNEETQESN